MDTVFMIVCGVAALGLSFIVAWGIGKIDKADKLPDWLTFVIVLALLVGGIFGAAWFYDAYREHVIEQEHARQYDNCKDHARTDDQCSFFLEELNN